MNRSRIDDYFEELAEPSVRDAFDTVPCAIEDFFTKLQSQANTITSEWHRNNAQHIIDEAKKITETYLKMLDPEVKRNAVNLSIQAKAAVDKELRYQNEKAEQLHSRHENRWNRRWQLLKGYAKQCLYVIVGFIGLVVICSILEIYAINPLNAWVAKTSYWITIPTFLGVGFVILVCIAEYAYLKKYNCKITLYCTRQGVCQIVMNKECIWKTDIPHAFIERLRTEKPDGSILVANMKTALEDGIELSGLYPERNLRTCNIYFTAIGTHVRSISIDDKEFYREDDTNKYLYEGSYTFGHVELPADIAEYALECMSYTSTKEKKEKATLKYKS